jgi:hypothetical protein
MKEDHYSSDDLNSEDIALVRRKFMFKKKNNDKDNKKKGTDFFKKNESENKIKGKTESKERVNCFKLKN